MRQFFLTGLALVGCVLGSTIVSASTRSTAPIEDADRTYWLAAHDLTQEQANLLDRVERSSQTPEAKRLKILSGQVLLYTSSVDRFLKSNYPEPELLCLPSSNLSETAGTDGATLEQVQVYCSLYHSTRALDTMRSRLDQQVRLIAIGAGSGGAKPTRQATSVNVASGVNVSNREILVLIEASRQRLAQMQPAFPEALRISIAQPIPVKVPTRSADLR